MRLKPSGKKKRTDSWVPEERKHRDAGKISLEGNNKELWRKKPSLNKRCTGNRNKSLKQDEKDILLKDGNGAGRFDPIE